MSWSQYVVVKELKCAFEVSRETSLDDSERFDEYMNKLGDTLEETDVEIFDTKVKDMSISEATKISNLAEKTMFLSYHCDVGTLNVYFMLYFLRSRKIKFEIIHEDDFSKQKKTEYKDYAVIRR